GFGCGMQYTICIRTPSSNLRYPRSDPEKRTAGRGCAPRTHGYLLVGIVSKTTTRLSRHSRDRKESFRPMADRQWPQIKPLTFADQVYEALRDRILEGELAPGEFIREQEVSDAMGVSRT